MEKYNQQLAVYLTEKEFKELGEVCKKIGLNYSSFCRMATLKKLSDEKFILDKKEVINGRPTTD